MNAAAAQLFMDLRLRVVAIPLSHVKGAGPNLFIDTDVQASVIAAAGPLQTKIEALELRIAKLQRDSSASSKLRWVTSSGCGRM